MNKQFTFQNKMILLISPQSWGTMHISKHHYALALAELGNTVYFLNPPCNELKQSVEMYKYNNNLFIITYKLQFNFNIRFHFRLLYDLLMRRQIRYLQNIFNRKFDVLWCFDANLYSDLTLFNGDIVIYHVVDQVFEKHSIKPAIKSDVIISVADNILQNFAYLPVKKLLLNHGLADCFANKAKSYLEHICMSKVSNNKIKIGYIGNLLISALDRNTLKTLISKYMNIEFHFWGCYEIVGCNIAADESMEVVQFIDFLKQMGNVTLHGPQEPCRVAEEVHDMDAFLVCYDIKKDANNGSNTHKLLEYLSTGKVVISNHISSYKTCHELIQMLDYDTVDYVQLFENTILNISYYNCIEKQKKRINFALQNRYSSQIHKIESCITQLGLCEPI